MSRGVGAWFRKQVPIGLVHNHNVAADLLVPGKDHLLCELGVGHHAVFHLRAGENGLNAGILPQERLCRILDLDLVELTVLDQLVITYRVGFHQAVMYLPSPNFADRAAFVASIILSGSIRPASSLRLSLYSGTFMKPWSADRVINTFCKPMR